MPSVAAGDGEVVPPGRRPRNRNWIWFFLTLLGLTLLAGGILIWYNFSQQLTPEQLEAARRLWEKTDLRDYDMEYTRKIGADQQVDQFEVRVRHGKVASVVMNRREQLPARLYRYHDMNGLFDAIEEFQKKDRQPGSRRVFTRALFDPDDGHLTWYVRRVVGSQEGVEIAVKERVEITVKLQRVTN
jgi:hypothetical protein